MTKLISILILSLSLISIGERQIINNQNNKKREIEIKGASIPSTRSGDLIRIFQNDTKLEAFFYNSCGLIQITICSITGSCIYQTALDTDIESHIKIDLASYNKGNYKIILTIDKSSLSGEFQL